MLPGPHTHVILKCKHGTLITQCRCPGPKTTRIVDCPGWCEQRPAETAPSGT